MKRAPILLFSLFILCLLVGVVGATTLTLYVNEDSNPRRDVPYPNGESISVISDGAGVITNFNRTSAVVSVVLDTQESAVWGVMGEGLLSFNLTNLFPTGSTIDSATLTTWGASKDSSAYIKLILGLTNATPVNPLLHAYTDYNTKNNVMMSDGNITRANFQLNDMNNFSLNSNGLLYLNNNINGNVNLMLRSTFDINKTYSGIYANWESSYLRVHSKENGNSTRIPSLTIVFHTTGDTTPPASITNLVNITTCQNITWQWTNPTDADFNHTMIWKNNVFQYNLTNVTTSDLWESLVENTEYTFSSKTVDITGNVNVTFVNLTSTTDTCPVPTTEPTTTATTTPPTTTTASPTPSPTPTPLAGCTYFNLTGVTFGVNSTDWNVTEGLNTWGVSTFNETQGNVSWWICRATPAPTIPATWQPLINPSTDIKTDWLAFLWQWCWLPVLILAMILLFGRK